MIVVLAFSLSAWEGAKSKELETLSPSPGIFPIMCVVLGCVPKDSCCQKLPCILTHHYFPLELCSILSLPCFCPPSPPKVLFSLNEREFKFGSLLASGLRNHSRSFPEQ